MSHDASHAKDVARAELVKLQTLVTEEVCARLCALRYARQPDRRRVRVICAA